jgi:hypothetical protein
LHDANRLLLDLLVAVTGEVLQKLTVGTACGIPQQADQRLHGVLLHNAVAVFLHQGYVPDTHGL